MNTVAITIHQVNKMELATSWDDIDDALTFIKIKQNAKYKPRLYIENSAANFIFVPLEDLFETHELVMYARANKNSGVQF